jgi:hypothetical protein
VDFPEQLQQATSLCCVYDDDTQDRARSRRWRRDASGALQIPVDKQVASVNDS